LAKRLNDHPLTDDELNSLVEILKSHSRTEWKWMWAWAILLSAAGLSTGRVVNSTGASFATIVATVNNYEKYRE
jgi:hypothetical protein